jgi:hypothetical protein
VSNAAWAGEVTEKIGVPKFQGYLSVTESVTGSSAGEYEVELHTQMLRNMQFIDNY